MENTCGRWRTQAEFLEVLGVLHDSLRFAFCGTVLSGLLSLSCWLRQFMLKRAILRTRQRRELANYVWESWSMFQAQ
jgi:hypothetical protein